MRQLKIKTEDILEALRRFGTNTSGGFINQQSREYLVRGIGLTTSLEDLRNTAVDIRGNQSILRGRLPMSISRRASNAVTLATTASLP